MGYVLAMPCAVLSQKEAQRQGDRGIGCDVRTQRERRDRLYRCVSWERDSWVVSTGGAHARGRENRQHTLSFGRKTSLLRTKERWEYAFGGAVMMRPQPLT